MTEFSIPANVDWSKGLIPAIVQDVDSGLVLMLGYMDAQALAATCELGHVTFYSRSKQSVCGPRARPAGTS